ncbi:MAG TPA: amidohydrolase [Actinobacteria bacterium]|nr:amidohydrolase [Actinomycetota bacterium]
MDPDSPRAQAVAFDSASGIIVAVGSLAECQATAPGVTPTDLGTDVLMPGFIEAHSHPVISGLYTQEPSHWISRSQGFATYADVQALWRKLDQSLPAGQPAIFYGLERPGQGAPELTNTDLDEFFASRPVIVMDISGHEIYFNSATIKINGWVDGKPPSDPEAARYGRNADGTSNGRAYEPAAVLAAAAKVQGAAIPHPLLSAARWYRKLAEAGITTSSEHAFSTAMAPAYEALASVPDSPIRVGFYHAATEPSYTQPFTSKIPEARLWKAGIKMWSDGTPFNGTFAASFPYLEDSTTKNAQIPIGPSGDSVLNYSRVQFDAILDQAAEAGMQVAVHAHGDVAIDFVLDGYASALARHGLLGTDHRWRIEHWTTGRADQFQRAVALGVATPLAAYQFIYQDDMYDGKLFPSKIGSQVCAAGDAVRAGARISFHSDSPVAPALPLLDVQCMVTRRTLSGDIHGPNQAVSVDDALKAVTINAAYHLRRDHDLGSIEVGKFADFVSLSADPYTADVAALTDQVKVLGTWMQGRKIDLDSFISEIQSIDPSEHAELPDHAARNKCC